MATPKPNLLRPLTKRAPREQPPNPPKQHSSHGDAVLKLAEAIAETRGGHGPLLTVNEASERLGVGIYRIYERIQLGDLPVVRMGRRIRIDQCALDAWIRLGGSEVSA